MDIGIRVTLTEEEGLRAKAKGLLRNRTSNAAGRPNNAGLKGSPQWLRRLDIAGAVAERVVAKWLDEPWSGDLDYDTRHEGDVRGYEVRFRFRRNGGLIVRPGDREDRIYILVTHERGWTFNVRGWIYGHEAKTFPLIVLTEGRPPCHVVLGSELHPPDTLPSKS